MIRVSKDHKEIILKDSPGFFEADPVLGKIGVGLVGVPVEAHSRSIPPSSSPRRSSRPGIEFAPERTGIHHTGGTDSTTMYPAFERLVVEDRR